MARGQWTNHAGDCQAELLALLRKAGGTASVAQLYQSYGAWGIRTSTIKALLRKGIVTCDGSDIWNDALRIRADSAAADMGIDERENEQSKADAQHGDAIHVVAHSRHR